MRPVAILMLLCLCGLSSLRAQDSSNVAVFSVGEPVLVWQKPLPATITGLSVFVGASPMFNETMHTQNLLIREEVQI